MTNEWTFDRLESLISNGVEESLSLDYKAAGALQRDDRKRGDITKDVSAMANAAGGVIIYGVREHQDKAKAHLPEAIDPVSRKDYPREWLEQMIQNARPRIEGVVIHPVPVPQSPDGVVYVVEIPQSSTAHQATDFRYYRRYNFESVPMHDYEVRDVMARRQHPLIEVVFHLLACTERVSVGGLGFMGLGETASVDRVYLCVSARNVGRKVANYVKAWFCIPAGIASEHDAERGDVVKVDDAEYRERHATNTVREITGYENSFPQYGDSRYEPILPELSHQLTRVLLDVTEFKTQSAAGARLLWQSHADDAPSRRGEVPLSSLKLVDERTEEDGS